MKPSAIIPCCFNGVRISSMLKREREKKIRRKTFGMKNVDVVVVVVVHASSHENEVGADFHEKAFDTMLTFSS